MGAIMRNTRVAALLLILAGVGVGLFVHASQFPGGRGAAILAKAHITVPEKPFKLGLDLSGGIELTYHADVSSIAPTEVKTSMDNLRDIIERRVNLFGVSEPVVQVEEKGTAGAPDERLIVEIPGVTNVTQAMSVIQQTPTLEFMTRRSDAELAVYEKDLQAYQAAQQSGKPIAPSEALLNGLYAPTELTGRFLKNAALEFNPTTGIPYILLTFDDQGKQLFADLTKANVGKPIAIFLDRELGNVTPITEPVVQEAITDGKAQITGTFTVPEAKTLVGRLNSGALPVDRLELLSTQTVGAPLGAQALHAGVVAGFWGLLTVMVFLVLWYRLPGVVATVALLIYTSIMLALFKLIPVTLTAAGIAGFILSIGMAVDANILVFERTKEELRKGRNVADAVREGFARAWSSIRDSNTSSIITAVILFWFGTSLIEGFALVFGLGVIVSMFSALTVTRTLLFAIGVSGTSRAAQVLFGSGFSWKLAATETIKK